jgi:hypothetical protein
VRGCHASQGKPTRCVFACSLCGMSCGGTPGSIDVLKVGARAALQVPDVVLLCGARRQERCAAGYRLLGSAAELQPCCRLVLAAGGKTPWALTGCFLPAVASSVLPAAKCPAQDACCCATVNRSVPRRKPDLCAPVARSIPHHDGEQPEPADQDVQPGDATAGRCCLLPATSCHC